MNSQETEKKPSDDPLESSPVVESSESPSVDDDYGLKKLTIYTLLFSITCLAVAGIWYKKDEIPFTEISDASIKFYNESSNLISENYNSIMVSLSDDDNATTEKAAIEVPANTEMTLTDSSEEQAQSKLVTINETNVNDVVETTTETAVIVETLTEDPAITDAEVIEVETVDTLVIEETAIEEVSENEINTSETTEVVTAVVITEASDDVIEVADTDVTSTEIISAEVIVTEETATDVQQVEIKATVATIETNKVDEVTNKSDVTETVEIKEPVNAIAASVVNHQPVTQRFQAPRGYAYAPAPYGLVRPAANMPYNNRPYNYMPYNNVPRNYMPQNNVPQNNMMMQRPHTFEQNKQMQKRVAEWKLQAKKRREAMNARYQQPAYMN